MKATKKKAEGTLTDMSGEQKAIVDRLKKEPSFAEHFISYPETKTTWNLLRFCRARDFNYEKTKTMLGNYFQFRIKANFPRAEARNVSEFAPIKDNLCRGFFGADKEGQLVCVVKPALNNHDEFLGKNLDELIQDYFVQLHERLFHVIFPVLSHTLKKRVDHVFMLMDMRGFEISKSFDARLRAFFEFVSRLQQSNYPELLGQAFVINAPWIFKGVWAVTKVFLDHKTCEKIQIESGSAAEKLRKFVDVEKLPLAVGGKSSDKFDDLVEPWKNELLDSYERRSFWLKDRSLEMEYYYTAEERKEAEEAERVKNARFAVEEKKEVVFDAAKVDRKVKG